MMNRALLVGSIASASAFGAGAAMDDRELDRRGIDILGTCVGPCENGGDRGWFDRTCTCPSDGYWGGVCCDYRQWCDGVQECPQDLISEHSVQVADMVVNGRWAGIGPRVNRVGDPNMQGVFWLTEQADSSALLTFAESMDGDDIKWDDDAYSIRVAGDRTWAFADSGTLKSWTLVKALDLVYHFKKVSDTYFNIIPEATNVCVGSFCIAAPTWLLAFDMELMTAEQVATDPLTVKNCGAGGCTGSVVWNRLSQVAGNDVDSKRYALTQVIDGNGNAIEPAWSSFVAQQSGNTVGGTPGTVHYRKATLN